MITKSTSSGGDPFAEAHRDTKPDNVPPAPKRKMSMETDPEQTLEARISRIEELEVLRVAIYQADHELQKAAAADDIDKQRHWAAQILEGQTKIAGLIGSMEQTVRHRLGATLQLRESTKPSPIKPS